VEKRIDMVKLILKWVLCVIVYTSVFLIINGIVPYSQVFTESSGSEDPSSLLFFLIYSIWVCFAIYYIIRNSSLKGLKLYFSTVFVLFFIQSFMTQIETLFFIEAFPKLLVLDVVLFMLRDLLSLLVTVPLMIKFFQNKDVLIVKVEINTISILIKLGIIGIIYTFVYMIFGYFVAWQFTELRIFYSGSPEKLSFIDQLINNINTNPVIYPFQLLRGILFGFFIVPLLYMINKKITFIISVCLTYLCTGIVLIIPNVLFPDMVRYGHLVEMISSMLLFGIIVGIIMWNNKNRQNRKD